MQAVLKQDNLVGTPGRLESPATCSRSVMFPRNPFDPGRPHFPGSGSGLGMAGVAKSSAGAHIHACLNQQSS